MGGTAYRKNVIILISVEMIGENEESIIVIEKKVVLTDWHCRGYGLHDMERIHDEL